METVKIIWNTYKDRREIVWLWFVFSYEEKWYILNTEKYGIIKEKIKNINNDLEIEKIPFIEINEEYTVKQKNIRAEKKANKYKERIIKNKEWIKEEERKFTDLTHNHDWAYITQPWAISKKNSERINKTMEKRYWKGWHTDKIEEAEQKASYWENKRYLTKAEKEDKKKKAKEITENAHELWRNDYKIGDNFYCWHLQEVAKIKKINKKTVIIESWSKLEIIYSKDFEEYLKKAKTILNSNK